MKTTIAEFGFTMIAVILVAGLFISIVPMFQDGGSIKNAVLDYITNLC